jgi:glycosyl hydrolase family 123
LLAWRLPGQEGPVVRVIPSLERIGLSDPAGNSTLAHLSAARGEYESFQIVVRAPENHRLTNVSVSATDLRGSSDGTIAKANVTFFREHYVGVTQSSPDWGGTNRPLGAGEYPDALIPFVDPETGAPATGGKLWAAPFNVAAGTNQPIWVDIFVPRTAVAGEYGGTFAVTSDQGSASVRVALRVWNFTLPLKPSLQSAFAAAQANGLAIARTLLRNKLSPLAVAPEHAHDLIENFGLRSANLGLWSGADVSYCTMSPAPAAHEVRATAMKYPTDLRLYDFLADEIGACPSLYADVRRWASALHKAGVKSLITMAPVPELLDDGQGTGRSAVDIWVVLPEMYDKAADRIARARAKGDEIWSYNTLVQDGYSPKWEIDFAPINFRIQPGFISQSLNLTGLLYWRVDMWPPDAWNNVNNAGKFSSNNYPGDGMLVYPGDEAGIHGVAPSMRLKWIRDGVEDYEYVALLKKAGYGDWALQVARTVGADWTRWTRDPNALESARQRLGQKLDELEVNTSPRHSQ